MNNTIGSCTTNAIKRAQIIQYCQQLMIVINVHGASTGDIFAYIHDGLWFEYTCPITLYKYQNHTIEYTIQDLTS